MSQSVSPVPLPPEGQELLTPPSLEEAKIIHNGVRVAAAPDGGLTEFQQLIWTEQQIAMTDFEPEASWDRDITIQEFAEGLAERNWVFRVRILQEIMLIGMLVRPTPPEMDHKLRMAARALNVGEVIINNIEKFGPASYDAAIVDFARNGYAAKFEEFPRPVLHTEADVGDGWGAVENDAELAAKWAALEHCPPGSLGRGVWDFYQSRGFTFPGLPGSAPPLLAQHDWVHVVADYGTTLENELEVFGFIGRADDDPRGFSLLAMIIGLFETGTVETGAGLFEADAGHLSANQGMAARLGDALRRGALARPDGETAKAFLAVDWFSYADLSVEEVRERFAIPPKSERAKAAGSVGPWDDGGISEFQLTAGRALAEREGRPYPYDVVT